MASIEGNYTSSHSTSTNYQQDEDQPWHIPRLRTWEINENSTRFDNAFAAPPDDSRIKMWFGWATIGGFVGFFALMIFIPIVVNQKIRNNPFNRYLIYLMVPDIIFSISCGVTCFFNGLEGHYVSEWPCKAQSFYFVFDVAANSWLNAAVCQQLFQMLSCAERFQRYSPPTLHRVNMDAVVIYVWAAFVASWGLYDQPWWPHKSFLVIGAACIPVDFSRGSTIFYYLIFFPALLGIPLFYVLYAGYQIRTRNLIPPTGKRRVLSIYFLRLVAVFVVMWLPALLLMTVLNRWIGYWVMWFGGTWSHMQGGVSAAVSLFKPDIAKTVYRFWTCQWGEDRRASRRRSSGDRGGGSSSLNLSDSFRTRPSFLRGWTKRLSSTPLNLAANNNKNEKGEVHISGLSNTSGKLLSGEEETPQPSRTSRVKSWSSFPKLSAPDESREMKSGISETLEVSKDTDSGPDGPNPCAHDSSSPYVAGSMNDEEMGSPETSNTVPAP
jgi:hypothetical protein